MFIRSYRLVPSLLASSLPAPLRWASSLLGCLPLLGLLACDTSAGGSSGAGDGGGGGQGGDALVPSTSITSSGSGVTSGSEGSGGSSASDGSGGGGSAGTGGSGGAGGAPPGDPCPSFAAELVDVTYGPGAGFGQADAPGIVFGPPRGAGAQAGSFDVLSLGNGGSITLGFRETRIVDEEGPDFLVFENAFWAGNDPTLPFAELGTVEVSADGETWHAFPCSALEAPFGGCAGFSPVFANPDENAIDPLDPAVAGGEAFDLADVGLQEARYVRIVDRADQVGFGGTFDLDAIGVVHGRCDAP